MSGAGQSEVDIVSQALILIGESPISSFAEGVGGLVASNLYAPTRDDCLTCYRWHFATGKKELSRLVETPLNEWQYAYQQPSDLLLPIRAYPGTRFEVFEDRIFANTSTLEIDYIFRPPSGAFPAYFVKALSYKLASEFAVTVTNNLSIAQRMDDLAVYHLRKAKSNDSQSRTPAAITARPWIDVRHS